MDDKEAQNIDDANEFYYRDLVNDCGIAIGPDAYIADDGRVSEDVLYAKVPDLVLTKICHLNTICKMLQNIDQGALNKAILDTPTGPIRGLLTDINVIKLKCYNETSR